MVALADRQLLSSTVVCRRAGVTYRQLDWMIRTGVITPTQAARGSGSQRRFTDTDLLAVWVAGQLGSRGAPSSIKDAAVQAVLTRDDPWAEALLLVNTNGAHFLTVAEITADPAKCRLLATGWAVGLPPDNLDATPPVW